MSSIEATSCDLHDNVSTLQSTVEAASVCETPTAEGKNLQSFPDGSTARSPQVAYNPDSNMEMFPNHMTMVGHEQMAWMFYHQQQQMHIHMMQQQHFEQHHHQQQHLQQQRTAWLESHVVAIEKKLTLQVKAHHATTDVLRTALNDTIADRDRLIVKIQEQRQQLNSMKKPKSSPSSTPANKSNPSSSWPFPRTVNPVITVAPPVITVTTPIITVTTPVTTPVTSATETHDMCIGTDADWVEYIVQYRHASLIQVNEDLVRAGLTMRQENDELQQQLKLSQARVVELEAAVEANHVTNCTSAVEANTNERSTSLASNTCSDDSTDYASGEHAAELARVQTKLAQLRQAHAKVDQARRQAQQELKLARQDYVSLETHLSNLSNDNNDTKGVGISTKSKNGRKKQQVQQSIRATKMTNGSGTIKPSLASETVHAKQIVTTKASQDDEATVHARMQIPVDPKHVDVLVSSPTEKWSDAQVLVAHILQDYMNATAFYRQDKAILEATLSNLRQTLTMTHNKSSTSRSTFERLELSGRFSFDSKVTMREIIQELNIKCIALDTALDRSQLSAKIAEERHELQKQLFVKVLRFNLIVTCHMTPNVFQGVRLALQENVRQMSRLLGTTEMPTMQTSSAPSPSSNPAPPSSSFASAEMD